MTPTNEAGHGLPELPTTRLLHMYGADFIDVYTAEQMRQYARDALALSRGVPDAVASRLRGLIAEIDSHRKPATGELRLVADELKSILALASAPAAAGAQGEVGPVDGCEDCAYNGRYLCDTHGPAPQPAAADGGVRERDDGASVSKRPTSAMKLLRFGRGNGATPWILEPHIDGYWTPWHVAQSELDMAVESAAQLERELEKALTQQCALSSHRQAGDDLSKFRELAGEWRRVAEKFHEMGSSISIAEGAVMRNLATELESLLALVEKGAG